MPVVADVARSDRAFLVSVVRHLAGDLGIRQFIDIGTGLPATNNTHEVAQQAAPESRIVYVDNDPIMLAHARALLTSHGLDLVAPSVVPTAGLARDHAGVPGGLPLLLGVTSGSHVPPGATGGHSKAMLVRARRPLPGKPATNASHAPWKLGTLTKHDKTPPKVVKCSRL